MKIIKLIIHPNTVIISFCMIMISGQHWGGFYLLYLLLALPHGGIHSMLAICGIAMLLTKHNKFRRSKTRLLPGILNVTGLTFLILSLFFFFYNDKEHYNYGTFYQAVPQITLIIFIILALIFLVDNVISMFKNLPNKDLDNKLVKL